jgi:hypothetical protein
MAIRLHNLDLESDGMKRHLQADFGDVAENATVEKPIFIAPVNCRVERVELLSTLGLSGNTSNTLNFRVQVGSASGTVIGTRTLNDSSTDHDVTAYVAYAITATANHDLTPGASVVLNVSSVCNAALSQVLVKVRYKPLLHKETV